MKKLKKVLLIVFIVFVGALFAVPQFFKSDILDFVKAEANKVLKAELEIANVSVSFFAHFPKVTFALEGLKITGEGNFANVDLVELDALELAVSLPKLISEGGFAIDGVYLIAPKVDVRVLESGEANYDIMRETEEAEAPEEEVEGEEGSSDFKLKLHEYAIVDGRIAYSDATMAMGFFAKGLNHQGSGDFTLSTFDMATNTTIDSTRFDFDGISYLNDVKVNLKAVFGMDLDQFHIELKENELALNNLKLGLKGDVTIGDDATKMNLSFNALDNRFADLMSLVPAVYAEGTEGFKISGTFGVSGFVSGAMTETSMPGFDIQMSVDNGRVLVADMPKAIQNINVGVHINGPESPDYKNLSVNVSKFHAEMAGNTFDLKMTIKEALGDPKIWAKANGKIDFGNLKDVLPLEDGQKIQGKIDLALEASMRLSDVENEAYDKVQMEGNLNAENILVQMEGIPNVQVFESKNFFSPKKVTSQARMKFGKSDLAWNGDFNNVLGFALSDAVLEGTFTLNSNLMDLNEMMSDGEGEVVVEETPAGEEMALEVVRIPKNIDLQFNAGIDRVVFEDYDISKVKGMIKVSEGKVVFKETGLDIFGGSMTMNGHYAAPEGEETHEVDLVLKAAKMDIKSTVTVMNSVQKLMPLAKSCAGQYGAGMSFKSSLNNDYSPVLNSINGSGLFEAAEVFIQDCAPLNKLAEKLAIKELAKQSLRDIAMQFEIKDGRINVKPFPIVLDEDISGKVSGFNSFDGTIDYTMNLEIPKNKMGGELASLVNGLAKQVESLGGDFMSGDVIKIDLSMVGPFTNPKLKLGMPNAAGGVKDAVKGKVNDKINEEKAKAKEALDAKKKEMEEAAQKKIDEAKAKAEEAKRKAEAEAKRKMEEEKAKMKEKAKDKMKDMFGSPK